MNALIKINQLFEKKYLYFVVLAIFWALLLRWPSHFEPLWYDDEAITLTVGQQLNHGEILYKDIIDHKTPILYWMAAAFPSLLGLKISASIIMVGIVSLYAYLSYLLFSEKKLGGIYSLGTLFTFVTVINLPALEGNLVNGEIVMTLFSLLGWCIYWYYFAKNRQKHWLLYLAGFMFGLGVMVKVPSGVDILTACLMITLGLKENKFKLIFKNLVILLTGALTPIFFVSLWFWTRGALNEFIAIAWLYNFGYVESWKTGVPAINQSKNIPIGIIIRASLGVFLSLGIWISKINIKVKFVIWWFIWSLFGALLSARPYPHYLIQVLPSGVLIVWSIWESKFKLAITLIGFLSLLFIVQSTYHFGRYPVQSYYDNFESWQQKKQDNADYYNHFDPLTWSQYQVANYIKAQLHEDENIWIYSDKPGIYVLSAHSPITRVITAYHIQDFGVQDETLESLKSKTPKLIIWGPVNMQTEKIETWIKNNYTFDIQFGAFAIWKKNEIKKSI